MKNMAQLIGGPLDGETFEVQPESNVAYFHSVHNGHSVYYRNNPYELPSKIGVVKLYFDEDAAASVAMGHDPYSILQPRVIDSRLFDWSRE